MIEITHALNQHPVLSSAWRLTAWTCAIYLLALGALAFVRPALVARFLDGFVASKRVNLLEAGLRMVAGVACIAVAPETRLAIAFWCLGLVLAGSGVVMPFLYGAHKRYAGWAVPFAKRMLPLIGAAAIALGLLIAWALS